MKLTAVFQEAEEGGFVCWLEEMPEVMSQGGTLKEAKSNLRDAFNLMLEYRRDDAKNTLNDLRVQHINVREENFSLQAHG